MNAFKTILLFVFGGAILGDVIATLFGRSAIPWWYTPGHGQIVQSQFPDTAVAIIGDVLRWQAIGGALGAIAGLVIGILIVRAAKRRAAATPAAPATPKP